MQPRECVQQPFCIDAWFMLPMHPKYLREPDIDFMLHYVH